MTDYIVKYKNINSNDIINLTIHRYIPEIARKFDNWYDDPKFDELKNRINEYYLKRYDEITKHYTLLEESILKKGMLNPILVTAGKPKIRKEYEILPSLRKKSEHFLITELLGGSRLYVAQKYNMTIPCIISDFVNMVDNGEVLETLEDVYYKLNDPELFTDIRFTKRGLYMKTKRFKYIPNPNRNQKDQIIEMRKIIKECIEIADNWLINKN